MVPRHRFYLGLETEALVMAALPIVAGSRESV
jgi:hypothetical protein